MKLNKLYNMDCIEGMKQFSDDHFDLALVDPPYGIGSTWSKSRKDIFYKHGRIREYQNETPPDQEYFNELFRISKNQVIWGGNYFTEFLSPTNAWIVWDKHRNADVTFMSEIEMAWTSFNKVSRIARFQWDGAKKCEKTDKIHPHQKPVSLYKWILMRYAQPGDRIIDTHVGSASSIIAMMDYDCQWVGFELDQYYYTLVNNRIDRYVNQLKIF